MGYNDHLDDPNGYKQYVDNLIRMADEKRDADGAAIITDEDGRCVQGNHRQAVAKQFGVEVKIIKQSDVAKCPFYILDPSHYDDQGCRCGVLSERERLISKYDYKPSHFANIPVRPEPCND